MNMIDIGTNKDVRSLFRMMGEDKKSLIDSFYNEHSDIDYFEFDNIEQIKMTLGISNVDNSSLELFKIYSGYNFRNINNVLRGNWNYEENGHEKRKIEYEKLAYEMKSFIDNNQNSIGNCMAFRGVTLDYFKSYGIDSLEDLVKLDEKFILDKGFVSTSLIEDRCFFQKENELGMNYNVKIKYLIPEEFEDGIYIGDDNLSYSPQQCEYIINAWNIAKVCSVNVEGDSAEVVAMMIPKKIYDDYYVHEGRVVK